MCFMVNGQKIFKTSGGMFEILYYEFEKITEEKGLIKNPEILSFMQAMQLHSKTMFPYFDIAEYINTSILVLILLNILEEAIDKLKNEIYPSAITSFWGFYKELMVYGDELVAQGK